MNKTRAGKYGKFLAILLDNYLDQSIPQLELYLKYKFDLIKELNNYSFEPRKRGTPKNSGCAWELIDISELNLKDPKHLAKLVKEGIHLMYQKQTQKRVLDLFIAEFLKFPLVKF